MNNAHIAIVEFVRANPGSSRAKIVAYTGIVPAVVTRALVILTRAGTLARSGIKRGATYCVARETSHA